MSQQLASCCTVLIDIYERKDRTTELKIEMKNDIEFYRVLNFVRML